MNRHDDFHDRHLDFEVLLYEPSRGRTDPSCLNDPRLSRHPVILLPNEFKTDRYIEEDEYVAALVSTSSPKYNEDGEPLDCYIPICTPEELSLNPSQRDTVICLRKDPEIINGSLIPWRGHIDPRPIRKGRPPYLTIGIPKIIKWSALRFIPTDDKLTPLRMRIDDESIELTVERLYERFRHIPNANQVRFFRDSMHLPYLLRRSRRFALPSVDTDYPYTDWTSEI